MYIQANKSKKFFKHYPPKSFVNLKCDFDNQGLISEDSEKNQKVRPVSGNW